MEHVVPSYFTFVGFAHLVHNDVFVVSPALAAVVAKIMDIEHGKQGAARVGTY